MAASRRATFHMQLHLGNGSLFATTALVAFAGAAAAEVSISGSAEMGIAGGNNGAETTFYTSADVRFRMTGETDGGLSFGATIDLEDAAEQADNVDNAGEFADYTVFISGEFGTLTMGDTDGAFDWALQELDFGGAIADDHTGHAGFSGNGGNGALDGVIDGAGLDGFYNGQVARYNYAFGDFSVAASLELPTESPINLLGADWDLGAVIGLGGVYSANGLRVGLGYQMASVDSLTVGVDDLDLSALGGSVGYEWDAFEIAVNLSKTKLETGAVEVSAKHMGIGGSYTTGALTLAANWGKFDLSETGEPDVEFTGYGVSANYDLGGGAVVQAGWGHSDNPTGTPDDTTYSFGLSLAF